MAETEWQHASWVSLIGKWAWIIGILNGLIGLIWSLISLIPLISLWAYFGFGGDKKNCYNNSELHRNIKNAV